MSFRTFVINVIPNGVRNLVLSTAKTRFFGCRLRMTICDGLVSPKVSYYET